MAVQADAMPPFSAILPSAWYDSSMTHVPEQAWQTAHPPCRGSIWLGKRPCVHRGFLQCWLANKLHQRIVGRVQAVVREAGARDASLATFKVSAACTT